MLHGYRGVYTVDTSLSRHLLAIGRGGGTDEIALCWLAACSALSPLIRAGGVPCCAGCGQADSQAARGGAQDHGY